MYKTLSFSCTWGNREKHVYTIFQEAEQILPFILRLKLELSLSGEIAFALLKKFYQVVADHMKSIWNGYQRT